VTGLVVISGCSGGGKSTLLAELSGRGHSTVPEPGRRVVRDELASGGTALPWADTHAFVDRVIGLARLDFAAASANTGWTFFDRGLIDAASALGHLNGGPLAQDMLAGLRYHRQVFLTPPWAEIYATDSERKHGFAEAEAEYDRLRRDYSALGYEIVLLPKTPVAARADFVERILGPGR
jgi:predicted ATPase